MQIPFSDETRRAWVDVDLGALVANATEFASQVGVPLLPMVKADGYGLGADRVAGALARLEPFGWGVATVDEAAALRQCGRAEPIIVFTPLIASQLEHHRLHGVRPVIGDLEALAAWLAAGDEPFHIEIDTGMSRSGFRWDDSKVLVEAGALLQGRPGWEGAFTHFHSADTDPESAAAQWTALQRALELIGRRPRLVHAASSAAGVLSGHSYSGDLARPGICMYGGIVPGISTRPVAALRARVVAIRRMHRGDTVSYGAEWVAPGETTVATLSIGYADGVPRCLGGRGMVQIGDKVVQIAGRVTMDQMMIDVGSLAVEIGDVATIFGGIVSLDSQAELAGTIGYELLTSLGPRLPRRYHEES